jgi:rhodanese-related sulfurtransferase/DNA-binding transcriptional ArsR family regulator
VHSREFKDIVFQQFARMAHAFSAPKRLEIVDVLSQGERDVETIAREARSSVANTSRHLQVLKHARLVETRKEGVRVIYRLADADVVRCWKNLQSLAESLLPDVRDAVRRYFEERDGMEPISRDELKRKVRKGEVIVLDVRPVEEYEAGHIPEAVSLPLSELTKRLSEIPADREVVAYCRGPYCVLSAEAVVRLREAGYHAVRLADGLPEWREAGLKVEAAGTKECKTWP